MVPWSYPTTPPGTAVILPSPGHTCTWSRTASCTISLAVVHRHTPTSWSITTARLTPLPGCPPPCGRSPPHAPPTQKKKPQMEALAALQAPSSPRNRHACCYHSQCAEPSRERRRDSRSASPSRNWFRQPQNPLQTLTRATSPPSSTVDGPRVTPSNQYAPCASAATPTAFTNATKPCSGTAPLLSHAATQRVASSTRVELFCAATGKNQTDATCPTSQPSTNAQAVEMPNMGLKNVIELRHARA